MAFNYDYLILIHLQLTHSLAGNVEKLVQLSPIPLISLGQQLNVFLAEKNVQKRYN